jgi:hypothetical protein
VSQTRAYLLLQPLCFASTKKYLLRLSGFKIFCLCLSLPMEGVSCRQLSPASALRLVAPPCPASVKPSTGPHDSVSYPQFHRVSDRKPVFLAIFPNAYLASPCKSVDDPCRRSATYRLCNLGHPKILPLHAGPAVSALPKCFVSPPVGFRSETITQQRTHKTAQARDRCAQTHERLVRPAEQHRLRLPQTHRKSPQRIQIIWRN